MSTDNLWGHLQQGRTAVCRKVKHGGVACSAQQYVAQPMHRSWVGLWFRLRGFSLRVMTVQLLQLGSRYGVPYLHAS